MNRIDRAIEDLESLMREIAQIEEMTQEDIDSDVRYLNIKETLEDLR